MMVLASSWDPLSQLFCLHRAQIKTSRRARTHDHVYLDGRSEKKTYRVINAVKVTTNAVLWEGVEGAARACAAILDLTLKMSSWDHVKINSSKIRNRLCKFNFH